ncbi:MAG: N4-gp56 family major capsid protein [Desulfobacteraceae bacterium]
MAATEFALGDALAVQRWSLSLAREAEVKQYFRKFMGKGPDSLIKVQTELNKQAGEKITVGLRMKLSGDGIEGDNVIEGTSAEEALTFFNDSLFVDQRRKGTKSKGKMSEQRVPYNLRKEGRDALALWYAEDYDQQIMMYLAGARGIDTSFHVGTGWTGRANNSLQSPDSDHLIYGGTADAKATLTTSDDMSLPIVERLIAKAETLDPMIQPFMINGDKHFVLLMHTFQAYSLRTSTSSNDWIEITKNAGPRGDKNNLFLNALGAYGGVILHKHRNVIRFDDYGDSADLDAARALFLGAQAGMIAWGGGSAYGRYSWNEEKDDRGNALAITAGSIYGTKKSRYNSKDFGVIAVDTYATDPNS